MGKRRVKQAFRRASENNELYRVGDYVFSLDQKELDALAKQGYIEDEDTVKVAKIKDGTISVETADKKEVAEETADIKHVGGGYYELPNGERVQGKEEALAALKGE